MKTLVFIFYFLLINFSKSFSQEIKNDSITIWIDNSKSENYSKIEQKRFLEKAYQKVNTPSINDKAKKLSAIAFRYYQLKDTILFKAINKETLEYAIKIKDSFNIADAHWNYATYYLKGEIYDKSYEHFNIALNHFNGLQKKYEAARMIYSMAFIKGRYRDFSGSEVLTIKAIEIFKNLKIYKHLYLSYNRMALLQYDIKEYERALFYHQKALQYLSEVKDQKNYYAISLNNIGLTNLKNNNYKKALEYFDDALNENKTRENYARIIDNKAYCRLMLNDTNRVKKDMLLSLHIRDSTNNKAGIVYSKIRLSKYYTYIKDTTKAYQYAKEANILAKKIKNGVDYLESLNQLAKLDAKNGTKYLSRYIQFNDSLINVERRVQNKFTRIDFETDEYVQETERLSEQKTWIVSFGISLILILSLVYFLRVQKVKNEKLLLETEQQKANEEVYLLTLKQQTILEKEKAEERNRISEELHDGVLGKLFGTRMGLGFLNIEGDENTQEKHQYYLNELQDIEKEIRDVSHKLNNDFNSLEINFTNIINQLLIDKSSLGNFEFNLNVDKIVSWEKINELTKVNMYRILQEALQNIVKHADAEKVLVIFSIKNTFLTLQIKDDGNGFESKKSKKGIGLKNIKSRIDKLNGKLQITSTKNKGTLLDIQIPI
ncbi:ATP-binding protein [Polaribacter sp. Asnod1-A03]|uniref:tetratricopeptide repeat-containing sensor histidine kinase n=1 Tax=Polaribacter sp. Asnod1-A03 TaxID=3160581 RepID=UPI003867533C